jgi:SNF2 family DNA or RNA helicase
LEDPQESKEIHPGIFFSKSPWFVRYLLQAHDDPSLLVEINNIWNPKGEMKKVLTRSGFNARHFVLSSLGFASGIAPNMEKSLKDAVPKGYELTSEEAFQFLTRQASLFEDSGYGVILPLWWTGKRKAVSARARVKSDLQGSNRVSIWGNLMVDWDIYLGGQKLNLRELEALAKLKEPLVQIGGKWILLSQEQIQKAISFINKNKEKNRSLRELMQLSLGGEMEEIPIEGVDATGWVKEFLDQLHGKTNFEELREPKGFCGTLRPYQRRGFSWLLFLRKWGLGGCLADDMGLGKTPQTLAAIQYDWEQAKDKRPTLLVCPTSLTGNWSKEAQKFTKDLPVVVHHGSEREKGAAFQEKAAKQGMVITSYGLLQRDLKEMEKIEWRGIILDEAQNIKNAQTKQAKSAYSLKADYKVALTGTPVENNVGDLWSLMHFINPGFLGTQKNFKENFFSPIQYQRSQETIEKLQKMTRPFIMRREKTDKSIISDLPEKQEMKVYCSLSKEQMTLYEATVRDVAKALEVAEGPEKSAIILGALIKFKQICNHPGQFLKDGNLRSDRSGKLTRLTEMLEGVLEMEERALIFTQFKEMGDILKAHLQEATGKEVLYLHGGTSKKNRDKMVDRFQSDDGAPIFLLSLKAGGTGLNLTNANHVFHYDRWWNPAIENQATDRAFRIGQTKNVQVHKFICHGTLEERIDELIEDKRNLAKNVIGSGEAWLTSLSTDDLKELFKLRAT